MYYTVAAQQRTRTGKYSTEHTVHACAVRTTAVESGALVDSFCSLACVHYCEPEVSPKGLELQVVIAHTAAPLNIKQLNCSVCIRRSGARETKGEHRHPLSYVVIIELLPVNALTRRLKFIRVVFLQIRKENNELGVLQRHASEWVQIFEAMQSLSRKPAPLEILKAAAVNISYCLF